jgi:hypothetical protein
MNAIDQSSVEHTSHQIPDGDTTDSLERLEHKIAGYDGGTRPVFKEPSLYLSIAIIFIATYACLSKTPTVFWLSSFAMIAVAISLHVLAERLLFRSNKEYDMFAAPLEGVFVVTLGAILPGIGLLAYGIYSLSTAQHPNVLEELGKIGLLLIVPLFNFIVWSAVKKGYLIRPRLIGLMNGLALGLSASWTVVWIKTAILVQGVPSCKFGWMLLLFTSPFMLFAAACLSFDLWRKTAPTIARITTTFAVLGGLLSLLFVFTPMARAFYVQFLLMDAKTGSIADQNRALPVLRSIATAEDLRPSKYPVGGFALAELLIPDRGLDHGTDTERSLFFKITGQAFSEAERNDGNAENLIQSLINPVIGTRIHGLSLSKSQINGSIDAATLSSSIDWSLTFHNSTESTQEARCEIALPRQAVVSRVTLWVNGEPRDAAVGSTQAARSAYVDGGQIDPLLVTMQAPDRLLVQCFRVQANGGEVKIRISFKVPLETADGKICSLKLPKLLDSNFAQPKRNRVNLSLKDMPAHKIDGMVTSKNGGHYTLSGIIKTNDQKEVNLLPIERTTPFNQFVTPDLYSHDKRYIVEQLKEVTKPAPKHLFVVIDSSASLKKYASQIQQALLSIPTTLKPTIILAKERDSEKETDSEAVAKPSEQGAPEKQGPNNRHPNKQHLNKQLPKGKHLKRHHPNKLHLHYHRRVSIRMHSLEGRITSLL